MPQSSRQLKLSLVADAPAERRRDERTRIEPLPARLTDLYRERTLVHVINISKKGLGLKVAEPFKVNFPVLIEALDVLIVGNVRHCMKSLGDGYVLGLEIHRIVDRAGRELGSDPRPSFEKSRRVRRRDPAAHFSLGEGR